MLDIFSTLFRYRDKKSPDKLGLYPQVCHVKAFPERRYLWTSRMLVIGASITICCMVILTLIIYLLIPLKSSRPLLYREQYGQLVNISRQYVEANPIQLVTENHIREYVNLRHSLPKNIAELYRRWNETSLFRIYSTSEIYEDFHNSLDFDKIKKYVRSGAKKNIEIKHIERLPNNLYVVYFKSYTSFSSSSKIEISNWVAYLRIKYITYDNELNNKEYLLNPYGFKVTSYSYAYGGKERMKQ